MKHVFRFASRSRSALLTMLAFVIVGGFLFTSKEAQAARPCGSIIGPVYLKGYDANDIKPIADCDDPFEVLQGIEPPVTVKINGVTLQDNDTLVLDTNGALETLEYVNLPAGASAYPTFFRHDGNDYRFYELFPLDLPEKLHDYFDEYFADDANTSLYAEALELYLEGESTNHLFFDGEENALVDEETGIVYKDEFSTFIDSYYLYLYSQPIRLPEGTYTVVILEQYLFLTQRSWSDYFKDLFSIPTAYAQEPTDNIPYEDLRHTVTFTVVYEESAPVGASSILFLPGIMGSELYEESGECALFGGEQRRWLSVFSCEQRRLKTDFFGNSINEIYTRPGTDAVASDVAAFFNLYDSFLEDLEDWKDDDIIADFAAVPYDWRLSLDAIIKTRLIDGKLVAGEADTVQEGYLYQTLEDLVASSKSGKVTMVTHSNGGLVAKYFLHALSVADDPLLEKVDNLILVGVPQVGTPDAVVALLHGSEIGFGGSVISQQVVREISNTAPFAHHLLPHESYFDLVDTPVIRFTEGSSTVALRDQFGQEIDSYDGLHDFLVRESGRPKPAVADLKTPEVVDRALLTYAETVGAALADFDIPDTLTVHQVAGTGVSTASAVEYFTSRICTNYTTEGRCTVYAPQLDYRAIDTIDGDKTVVAPSALALPEGNGKRWWVDLVAYDNDNFLKRVHKDLFEIADIRNLVKDVAVGEENMEYEHIFDDISDITRQDGPRLIFQLHSPLDLSATTPSGGVVSSSTNTIPGASYQRYGELQFISLPEEEEVEVLLDGLASGSFSLDLERKEGEERTELVTLSGVPTATGTKASVIITEDMLLEDVSLEVDFNGNGEIDSVYTEATVVFSGTSTSTLPVAEAQRRSGGGSSFLRKTTLTGVVAGIQTMSSEELLHSLYLQLIPLLKEYYQILVKNSL